MSDTQTIRSRLKRRVRWCGAVGIIGVIAFVVIGSTMTKGEPPSPVLFAPLALVFPAMLALQYAISCPRCSGRIGQELGWRLGFGLWGKEPNFCPWCGVSFDEACSTTTGPTTSVSASRDPIQ